MLSQKSEKYYGATKLNNIEGFQMVFISNRQSLREIAKQKVFSQPIEIGTASILSHLKSLDFFTPTLRCNYLQTILTYKTNRDKGTKIKAIADASARLICNKAYNGAALVELAFEMDCASHKAARSKN